MRRVILIVFGAAVLSIVGAQRAFCADVVGKVADAQGRPVAKVKIVVESSEKKILSEAHSDADGRYQVTGLKPGTYNYILDPGGSGFKSGDAVSNLGPKGLTIDWHLSATNAAVALASDGAGTMLAGDPFGFTATEFTGIVLGSGALIGGGVAGGLAASGQLSGSSSGPPASPSL
jgi:membrane-associated protease RseP (regulator of RpoE activity)